MCEVEAVKETADCDRLDKRVSVLLQARCRKSSWKVFDVELENISAGGCCIVGGAPGFEPMQPVSLRFAGFRNIDATVRWIAREKVGLEFVTPLRRHAVEALARTFRIAIDTTPPRRSAFLASQIIDPGGNDSAASPS